MGNDKGNEVLTFTLAIKKQTPKAHLVSNDKGECWLPKSQVNITAENPDTSVFEIPQWLVDANEVLQ